MSDVREGTWSASPPWVILFDNVKTLSKGTRLRGRHKTLLYGDNVSDFSQVHGDDNDPNHNMGHSISGVMWYAPESVAITLYSQQGFTGSSKTLRGSNGRDGSLQFINLEGFNDAAMSLQWSGPRLAECQVPLWCVLFDKLDHDGNITHYRDRHKTFIFPSDFPNFKDISTDDSTSSTNDRFSGAIVYHSSDVNDIYPVIYRDKNYGGESSALVNSSAPGSGVQFIDFSHSSLNHEASSLKWNNSEPGGQLSLHAKVYFDNPDSSGGEELYIDLVRYSSNNQGFISFSGATTWKIENGYWRIEGHMVGGTVYVKLQLYNPSVSGFEGATLTLKAEISYSLYRPSTVSDPGWQATLNGSKYQVTRVTP